MTTVSYIRYILYCREITQPDVLHLSTFRLPEGCEVSGDSTDDLKDDGQVTERSGAQQSAALNGKESPSQAIRDGTPINWKASNMCVYIYI